MASLNSHRKFLQISPPSNYSTSNNNTNDNYTTVQTCLNNYCNPSKNTTTFSPYSGFCPKVCLAICPSLCHYSFSTSPLPLDFPPTQPNKPQNNHSPLLISMLILLATTFLLISIYILYTKLYFHFYAPNNNTNSFFQRRNDPLHEEHGHRVVFHPFWYISTVGLPTMAIQRIAVVKYGKSMEERDCAVCLADFEEGEDLRVLPKCSHAFHVLCIDTWLSSHTNCPLCRAPIFPPDHHHVDDQSNLTVENTSSSVQSVDAAAEDNFPDGELRVNMENTNISTTREVVGVNDQEYCIDNLRRVDNNKRSYSHRWSLESGAVNMLSRSLSCSGKIFSSRCCNRP